jgi:hypothetical protein
MYLGMPSLYLLFYLPKKLRYNGGSFFVKRESILNGGLFLKNRVSVYLSIAVSIYLSAIVGTIRVQYLDILGLGQGFKGYWLTSNPNGCFVSSERKDGSGAGRKEA